MNKNPEKPEKEALYLQCDFCITTDQDTVKLTKKLKGSFKTSRGVVSAAKRVKQKLLKTFSGSNINPPFNFCIIKVIEIL